MNPEALWQLDRQHVWHPYTKFSTLEAGPLPMIVRGEGIHLFDADGNRYVDAISSWWSCTLGHGHPRIIRAIREQAGELQQSILGNLSHPPAVELAAKLAQLMPSPDRHVLFASDGSSAVEAALKMAVQYWANIGVRGRGKFLSLEDSYHGDTLGAVGVGYLEHFHQPIEPIVVQAYRVSPRAGIGPLAEIFDTHAAELAAVIVEPLCQCAAGMKMYPPDYLAKLAALCREKNVLLIADEIATGFGRTGRMFAFEYAGIDPDIVCVGKGLSAGYLPICATIAKDGIYRTFSDAGTDRTFYHGHTFSGNPIAVAAALEALRVYREEDIAARAVALEKLFRNQLDPLATLPHVREVRCLGAIAAVELGPDEARGRERAARVRQALRERGILVRPLGNVVYLMPPLNTRSETAQDLAASLVDAVRRA